MSLFKFLKGVIPTRTVTYEIPDEPMGLRHNEVITYRESTHYVRRITSEEDLERIRRHQINIIAEKLYNDGHFFIFDRTEEGSPFTESIVSLDIVVR